MDPAAGVNSTGKICYPPYISNTNGVWQGKNPLIPTLPLFVGQLTFIIVITRSLFTILKPFHQPRFVAGIVGGMILGATAVGKNFSLPNSFPAASIMTIEKMSSLSLVLYVFITGLQMDLSAIVRTSSKGVYVSVAGVVIPIFMGIGLFFLMLSPEDRKNPKDRRPSNPIGCLFWGFTLCITSFPILARTLSNLKLLHSELGRVTLSAAVITDMAAWALLVILLPATMNPSTAVYAVVTNIAFIVLCVYVVRPILIEIIRRTTKEDGIYSDVYICAIVISALICGAITNACGTHAVVGAFVFGLIVPNGDLLKTLIVRLEDFVVGILVPVFYATCGVRIDIGVLVTTENAVVFSVVGVMVVALACTAKIVSTLLVAFLYDLPPHESMAVGVLLNTKGALAVLVLNVGWDKGILSDVEYAAMVVAIVVMTAAVGPVISYLYPPKTGLRQEKRRTIQGIKPGAEFRILACLHNPTNLQGMINLLAATNATKESPLYVFGVHLVELTGRASAMLIVHNTRKSSSSSGGNSSSHLLRGQESNSIIAAFENFEQQNSSIFVQPLTAMSPYGNMHEDICNLAEDKRTEMILIPFHKQSKDEDEDDQDNNAFVRTVTQSVLAGSPCSVGIFVDGGLGTISPIEFKRGVHRFAMLFLGGPDDREALSYAWRTGENPGVNLHVIRFVLGEEDEEFMEQIELDGQRNLETEGQTHIDDEYINNFRLKSVSNPLITYSELVLNNVEETVAAIRGMDGNYDLFIVGKGQGMVSPLTAGLSDWSDYPELGTVGDMLVSSSFDSIPSVLVVQQFDSVGDGGEMMGESEGLEEDGGYLRGGGSSRSWRPPGGDNDGFELISRHREQ